MEVINRSAIVVTPAQPFLDWLRRVDSTSADLTLEDLRVEPGVYLLPDCESEKEALDHLRHFCQEIFEEQLDSWYRDPSVWPKRRDLKAFRRWFEWSLHSMVFDVCEGPIEHEKL